ncbi:hypothetical protein Tco_1031719 [Tanacetum coccineum]|uniref:Uncharacterized protein n=1 Tax=Tanacetum coccineum TaxID=301880 RepID=A0ABQ5G9S9_9ASTR
MTRSGRKMKSLKTSSALEASWKFLFLKQSPIVDYPDNDITSDSNIIPYSQYLEETQQAIVQNTNTSAQQNSMILSMFEQMSNHATNWDKANNESKIVNESLTAELERYKERVKILEQRFNVDLSGREKFIDSQMDDMIRMKNTKFAAFETEIDTLKQALSKHVKEKESLLTTLNGFKTEFKERESKSIDKEIVLENKNKELENIVYFGKRFVPQLELSAEQKFWLESSDKNFEEPSTSNTPIKIEVPSELSKGRVISYTGASGSKPTGNTKNNMISQSSSSNKTNKVEDQSMRVKSRKNKKNHVAKTECNAYVMQSMLNVNSKSVCAISNE